MGVGDGRGGGVAAAWANPRGGRGCVPCHLTAPGLFCIMHEQHVRRTLTLNEDQQPCTSSTANTYGMS